METKFQPITLASLLCNIPIFSLWLVQKSAITFQNASILWLILCNCGFNSREIHIAADFNATEKASNCLKFIASVGSREIMSVMAHA